MAARRAYDATACRYPHERTILALTLVMVFLIIALTSTATLCAGFLVTVAVVVLSYARNRAQHQTLLQQASPVTPERYPALATIVAASVDLLQVSRVEVFLAPGDALNAYTFGLFPPQVVVLLSPLLQVMDEDELRFVLGHELGHVRLGHTWLNSLVGGMAGVPSPFMAAAVLSLAFLWWNRACEYSADRAGLLACGKPHKAISALVKLALGTGAATQPDLARAWQQIEAEDDSALAGLGEALSTHPMMIRRIEKLRRYADSAGYRRLQERVAQRA